MVAKPVKSMAVADLTRKRKQKAEEARFFIRYLPNAIVVRSHAQASGARQHRQKTSMFDAGTRRHGDAAIRGIGSGLLWNSPSRDKVHYGVPGNSGFSTLKIPIGLLPIIILTLACVNLVRLGKLVNPLNMHVLGTMCSRSTGTIAGYMSIPSAFKAENIAIATLKSLDGKSFGALTITPTNPGSVQVKGARPATSRGVLSSALNTDVANGRASSLAHWSSINIYTSTWTSENSRKRSVRSFLPCSVNCLAPNVLEILSPSLASDAFAPSALCEASVALFAAAPATSLAPCAVALAPSASSDALFALRAALSELVMARPDLRYASAAFVSRAPITWPDIWFVLTRHISSAASATINRSVERFSD